jgi:predicted transcriptional regulator of viral defense system
MGRKNQLDANLHIIEDYFERLYVKSFTEKKLRELFENNRFNCEIPNNKSFRHVLNYLLNKKFIIENNIISDNNENTSIYSWKNSDELTIIAGLKNQSYYSYYTAMYIHQLSLQIPKTIYLNFEHSKPKHHFNNDELSQESIDKAFEKEQRKSSNIYQYMDKKIILTNGKYTGRLGVIDYHKKERYIQYTDIERTLIDIAIRPVYAGGVFEVLNAYKKAKGTIDISKLVYYLNKLAYLYPYHQAIGFYLEKSEYSDYEINLLASKAMNYKFYLTYNIRNKEFSKRWQLFYPKGF